MMFLQRSFKLITQLDEMDCGPTCLMMICQHYGKFVKRQTLRDLCDKSRQGVSLLGLNYAAEELGFKTLPVKIKADDFLSQAQLPCIAHWKNNHFIVIYKIKKNRIFVADPSGRKVVYSRSEFCREWSTDGEYGVALFLQTTNRFSRFEEEQENNKNGILRLLTHLLNYKNYLWQLFAAALLGTILNLAFPFLTQALVDIGIASSDVGFVYAVALGQLVLFLSRTLSDFIRGWLLVHLGTRINIAILSEFLIKLMRLPLSFFNQRNLGDVLQRIADHKKIEEFLTAHTISTAFATLNLIAFSAIMLSYSAQLFLVFITGSVLSILWTTLFLNRRRKVDNLQFEQMTASQNSILQIVNGMPEIKLNQCESSRRWEWEEIQSKLFRVKLKSLAIEQYQQAGSLFLNEGKNISITILAAQQVIEGKLSLGMMMAISYILGQMNSPIEQFLNFIRIAQDAKISMERLGEVQDLQEEGHSEGNNPVTKIELGDIIFNKVFFKYSKHDKEWVLNDINFTIPHNKTTALVGASGSGKTTILKLLLKFDHITSGSIGVNGQALRYLNPENWRTKCGVVMQDGFIFSDSVLKNISMADGAYDHLKVVKAAKIANIHEEIEALPKGYNTTIGIQGHRLSGGQEQRILIARAIYKDPDLLIFDEATSSLDATNERIIQKELRELFKDRTVLVVAHRLSTVRNADQIVVLDKGTVVEIGSHDSLTEQKGYYYRLVKDQLELGS